MTTMVDDSFFDPALAPYRREGREALYIAEIGLNHNGCEESAFELIDRAADAGADMAKFQTFVPEKMNSLYTSSLLAGKGCQYQDTTQVDFLSSLTLSKTALKEVAEHCTDKGITFFSAPFDVESLELLEEMETPVYKVASSEVTHLALLRELAHTGKPVILSTGMSTMDELHSAVDELYRGGCSVTLLHCVSLYPYQPSEANIARVGMLRQEFHLPVGLSDHSKMNEPAILAAGQGARVFEKHFTIDSQYQCPDKDVSITGSMMKELIGQVELAIELIGGGVFPPGSRERDVKLGARRSLFAAREIAQGQVITASDLVALRPGTGIPADRIDHVMGKKAVTLIEKGVLLSEEMYR